MINKFNGKFSFLSNFSASRIVNEYGVWPTAEHLFQSAKTADVSDKERIRLATSPGRAKRMGRNVILRQNWEQVKIPTMLRVIRSKFNQNPDLAKKLLATGNEILIEGNNWHDNEWGDCQCSKCSNVKGKNILGEILMQVRRELEGSK